MTLYMDVHNSLPYGATATDLAGAHAADLRDWPTRICRSGPTTSSARKRAHRNPATRYLGSPLVLGDHDGTRRDASAHE